MAYVVRRAHGRFEIRESVHTPRGPRARTLASFSLLTDALLDAAGGRAQRPFGWLARTLGPDSEQRSRLAALL